MASRYLNNTLVSVRPRRPRLPGMSALSRSSARAAIAIITLIGALLFLYLAQASHGALTAYDIDALEREYNELRIANQELERRIAESEGPQHVLQFAEANGMVERSDVLFVAIPIEVDGP
ncbi:MAG: hypothetical protein KDD73_00245 [Anaerolineales bacterium]|nr:hypothetical protein [Anaerolineales bacterium]MCB9127942.1 hypothetical protein [Ardenticatenales bacterium]MCB9171704.1 hypothetical protein [Ardenticatenales bacterium]